MTETFDDAVKPERAAFAQPFNEVYGITDCSRRVKIVLDGYRRFEATCRGQWKQICRKEFETAGKRRCIENALKWVNAR